MALCNIKNPIPNCLECRSGSPTFRHRNRAPVCKLHPLDLLLIYLYLDLAP